MVSGVLLLPGEKAVFLATLLIIAHVLKGARMPFFPGGPQTNKLSSYQIKAVDD